MIARLKNLTAMPPPPPPPPPDAADAAPDVLAGETTTLIFYWNMEPQCAQVWSPLQP